jgi:hypothetical protein
MKLRFQGNTLRLRLSQSDVTRFAESGRVEEQVIFAPGQTLGYVIESGAVNGADAIRASFDDGTIRVTIPSPVATHWIEGNEVGIEGSHGPLHILVEKDFQCLHRDAPQDADAFPNPLAEHD